jgi:excisionase family DNA binding protein
MDSKPFFDQLTARGGVVALIPSPRGNDPGPQPTGVVPRKWYTVREVADMLGYGLSKTKMLVATGELRSLKDGKNRRILPEWVDEYVVRKAVQAVSERTA